MVRGEPKLGESPNTGSRVIGEAIPCGIVARAGACAEEALPHRASGNLREFRPRREMSHLVEVVEQQFGAAVVAVADVRQFARGEASASRN